MLIAIFIVLCALAALASGVMFIMAMENDEQLKATFLKGMTTVCCIIIAAFSMFYAENRTFALLIVIGLCFGCAGDVLLALRFVHTDKFNTYFLSGAGSFLVGHIFYLIALYSIALQSWKLALPLTAVGLAVELFNTKRHHVELGKLFLPLGVYAAFVCFMGCSAVSCCIMHFSIGTLLFAIAGVCFIISDSILSVQCFGDSQNNHNNRVLHIFYWIAQLLIAVSPLFI